MSFKRFELDYSLDSLEPYIDAKTMEIHSEKHHQAYTDKLNEAVSKHEELKDYSIEELLGDLESLPEDIRDAVRNNGGGFANHNLFFSTLKKDGEDLPTGKLAEAINSKWGDFDTFKKEFATAATTRFGSGWAFLALNDEENLYITSKPNQDTPLMDNHVPIIGLDVWEHAYYLKYQNKRPDYIEAFWSVLDWAKAESNYVDALSN